MTTFARGRWSVAIATALALVSMTRYPGGTLVDRATRGYTPTGNFLSDLGMTVAWNGQSNRLGAALFVASLAVLVVGFGPTLFGFVRLYAATPAARPWARAAAAAGVLVCLAFLGVALTPENRALNLHIRLTFLAFRLFLIATLLMALAALRAEGTRRMAGWWAALTAALAAFVAMITWGPDARTADGLVVQVVAQKLIAIVAPVILVVLTLEAERKPTRV